MLLVYGLDAPSRHSFGQITSLGVGAFRRQQRVRVGPMADNVHFKFESVARAREAMVAAMERDLSAVVEESDGTALVRVPRAQLLEAEVLLMRHGGHRVQDDEAQG